LKPPINGTPHRELHVQAANVAKDAMTQHALGRRAEVTLLKKTDTTATLPRLLCPRQEYAAAAFRVDADQILYFVEGECEATLNGETRSLVEHDIVYVPAGTEHNFVNSGQTDLKLFTVYAPPQHPDGTVHATKADAQKAESHEANA
jgi:mannose-6-phosphate isomerase-like protein (cupin superfamily)